MEAQRLIPNLMTEHGMVVEVDLDLIQHGCGVYVLLEKPGNDLPQWAWFSATEIVNVTDHN